jgi:Flp pilus assembly protein TadD
MTPTPTHHKKTSASRTASPGQAIAVLAVGALLVGAIGIPYTEWWRESRLRAAPLEQLQQSAKTADPIGLYWLGQRLNEQERYHEAAPVLERAAQADPASPRIRDAWAQSLLASGKVAEAMAQLKQFAASRPNDAAPQFLLGKMHNTLGAEALAQTALEKAVALNPNDVETLTLLGDVLLRREHTKEAIVYLQRARALEAKNALVAQSLGRALALTDAGQAEKLFSEAATLAPQNADIRRENAAFLYKHGKPDKAETEARATLALVPQDPQATLVLGRCLLDRKAFKEAEPVLESAVKLAPYDPVASFALFRLYERTGEIQKAATMKQRYFKNQEIAAQERRLLDALLVKQTDPQTNLAMANHEAKLGKVENSIRYRAIALRATLDNPAVLQATADALEANGYPSAAQAVRQRIRVPRSPAN